MCQCIFRLIDETVDAFKSISTGHLITLCCDKKKRECFLLECIYYEEAHLIQNKKIKKSKLKFFFFQILGNWRNDLNGKITKYRMRCQTTKQIVVQSINWLIFVAHFKRQWAVINSLIYLHFDRKAKEKKKERASVTYLNTMHFFKLVRAPSKKKK